MKKSLIALAVLAASGASFAQVSITGNLTYGYASQTTATANGAATQEAAGLGAETANVVFTAKEDLGGGYAATASMKLNTKRGTGSSAGNAEAGDHTLTLATPVGGLVLGTVEGVDYLGGGVAGVGAYTDGWDGKIHSTRTYRDLWAFVVPVGAFKFVVGQQEPASNIAFGTGTTGSAALGTLLSSSAFTNLGVTYSAGPLVADAQYLAYKNPGVAGTQGGLNKDTARMSVSYDLGVAKLGAGYSVSNVTGTTGQANPKVTDMLVAARIPMGASSFGVSFASRTWDDAAATLNSINSYTTALGANTANATGTGYALEYGYAMSKRTSVIANYARWTQASSGILANADASSKYTLLLAHTF